MIRRGIESSKSHRTFFIQKYVQFLHFKCGMEVIYDTAIGKNFFRNKKES